MVLDLARSIKERDKRETARIGLETQNRPGMVRTEDRMVRTGEMITRTGYLETPGNGQYQPNLILTLAMKEKSEQSELAALLKFRSVASPCLSGCRVTGVTETPGPMCT
ncbi:hypothetical protein TREMEDRAFT_66366 [Tremella mesenterica DSM 1558]|uniref:uncharacterized protein n=1 Tax=Tremella mesenterica (strain ATCC 24925 / CBS 8224 / DSM 1558 / NBRC 9311 / NRRL Y-6157 / RJB 2259-6 / UBC 559-6) TaxID=578456 RepID=UPI00032C7EAD|nr:uncharacterized protein TREMEDRAFT_66366 [Tremella mesenterica DSM 1558]EIW65642.1 hypothetical protein TREMEDRAFT_66366 [Tremella mesenterica DSM 1558]